MESYGADYVKGLPEAEGTIVDIFYETDGSFFHVEFWDGNQIRLGKSIQYVGVRKKYHIGDKVMIWYKMKADSTRWKNDVKANVKGKWAEARVVLQNPQVISLDKKQSQRAWMWFVVALGFVILDVILIIQQFMTFV